MDAKERNKETLIEFAKVTALVVLGLVGIATTAGIWNAVVVGAIGKFYGWVAGVNIFTEVFGVWSLYKKFFPKKN